MWRTFKKTTCGWTLSKTISVWSLKKCEVSKCLRLNGWNNIVVLKHPQSLSRSSICLSTQVCLLVCFQHSTYMFQPETSRGVTRRIRNLHSQIPNAGFWRSGLLMSHARESWNNTRQGSAWRERMLERSSSDPHPEKKIRSTVSRETSWRGFIFTKDCISEGLFMACCQVDLSSVPTHAENYPPTLRGVHTRMYKCIIEPGVYVSQLPSDSPTNSFTFNSSVFPSDVPQCLPFYWKEPPPHTPPPHPPEWVMAEGEQGSRSDGQFGWAM